jgi:hypothetical protein
MKGLSRREFISGTAGVAAGAILPSSSQGAAPAIRPLVGATVSRYTYDVSSYLQAANIFDGYIRLPLARTIRKVYMGVGQFGTLPPLEMTQLAATACQFLVDVRPSKKMTPTERSRLANWLAMLKITGIPHRVILYAECNNKAFSTAEEWLAYWRYYAPTIREAGVPCCYDPGCNSEAISRAESFFPSRPAPDELWMDFYATSFRGGVRIDRLIAKALAADIPVGLAEWGWHAGKSNLHPMTMPWWNRYCTYLLHLAGEGKLRLGTIYFGSAAEGLTVDVISSAKDPRIPMIQKLAIAVQNAP